MDNENNKADPLIMITLPARQWVCVIATLDLYIRNSVVPQIKKLKAAGVDYRTHPDAEVTALAGPVIARSVIIDAMVEHGCMTKAAGERNAALWQRIEDFQRAEAEKSD